MGTESIPDSEFSDVELDHTAPAAVATPVEGEEGEGEAQEGAEAGAEGGEGEEGKAAPKKEGEGEGDDPLRDDAGKFKSGFQSRIDRLTRDLRSAERRAATAEALISARDPSDEGAPKAKPDPKDFSDYGEYVEALTDWKADERERSRAGSTAKDAGKEADSIRGQIWSEKVQAAKASIKDFDAVVGKSEIELRSDIVPFMIEADKGPELLFHLAQNPDLVARLNEMSPARAAMELGRIEQDLGTKSPPPKNPSKAPAPIDPVKPGSSTSKKIEDIDDMDDYVKRRKSQGASWA